MLIALIIFLNLIFILYWSIVDLQCCISFRHTAKWFSYTYTYTYSFPIKLITEYWVEFPVLCSRSLLVIYCIYNSVCMSVPNSQFIPPPPHFPFGNHKFVFEVCESISVLWISSFVSLFLDSTCKWYHMIFVFLKLLLLLLWSRKTMMST